MLPSLCYKTYSLLAYIEIYDDVTVYCKQWKILNANYIFSCWCLFMNEWNGDYGLWVYTGTYKMYYIPFCYQNKPANGLLPSTWKAKWEESERERERCSIWCFTPQIPGEAGPGARAQNSICVSHMRKDSTWAIFCYLLAAQTVELEQDSQNLTQAERFPLVCKPFEVNTWCRMSHSHHFGENKLSAPNCLISVGNKMTLTVAMWRERKRRQTEIGSFGTSCCYLPSSTDWLWVVWKQLRFPHGGDSVD